MREARRRSEIHPRRRSAATGRGRCLRSGTGPRRSEKLSSTHPSALSRASSDIWNVVRSCSRSKSCCSWRVPGPFTRSAQCASGRMMRIESAPRTKSQIPLTVRGTLTRPAGDPSRPFRRSRSPWKSLVVERGAGDAGHPLRSGLRAACTHLRSASLLTERRRSREAHPRVQRKRRRYAHRAGSVQSTNSEPCPRRCHGGSGPQVARRGGT